MSCCSGCNNNDKSFIWRVTPGDANSFEWGNGASPAMKASGFNAVTWASEELAKSQSGLGKIPFEQVAALEDYVVAGSVVAWGGKIYWPGTTDLIGWHDDGEARIKNALASHGGFSSIDAGNIGSAWHPYISIVVTTNVDFAHLGNILTTIEGAIWAAGYQADSQNFWVNSIPQSAVGKPSVAQPNAGAGTPQPSGGGSSPSWLPDLSSIFGSSSSTVTSPNFLDRFASMLGIGQTEAAVIGGLAVVAGILIVKKAL